MKSKELIRLLQEADPDGETEVAIGNADIIAIIPNPAYWDGSLEVFIRDEKGNIIGGKYKTQGSKINIWAQSISERIDDLPDDFIDIDYSELSEENQIRYKEMDEKCRHESRVEWHKIRTELELNNFTEWMKKKVGTLNEEGLEYTTKFCSEKLSYNDPITDKDWGKSYVHKRFEDWERRVSVTMDENSPNGFVLTMAEKTNEN